MLVEMILVVVVMTKVFTMMPMMIDDVNNLKVPVEATNSKVSASLISQRVIVDHV